MSRLLVRDLVMGYGRQPVLRGVTLEARAGSLTAVLGLSGCGKTTLLRVIAGFERAQGGSVVLGERTLDGGHAYVPPERRDIGYVPQEGALFPHLTVAANVGFGLSRRERRGARVSKLLEMVGIAALAQRLPHELSGGEQQRVALARALARRPSALLLDEPFSSLDATLRSLVREEVHALLLEQGVTTVLVTHDQEEALSLAATVAVLRDGRIVQQGSPADLYERPVDAALAGFIGAVNRVAADFRGATAVTALGSLPLRDAGSAPSSASGSVLVRPEQIVVTARRDGETRAPGIPGRVQQCRYYGHDAVLEIAPDSGQPAPAVLARVLGEQALPPGTAVTIAARGAVTAADGGGGAPNRAA